MKTTFEEACRIGWEVTRPEAFRAEGHEVVVRRLTETLAKAGWTTGELCDEAARRMRVRIEELRRKEAGQ